ncbi:MAG TPA: hypothetical protein VI583_00100 [Cyclobacteriaceae bacterium]|nr:hypothetical protein [Cyclobacteriaceae bacterium]
MKKNRIKSFIITLILVFSTCLLKGQQLGMSFSFFFPRNGSFSNPVSPFSFRGIGLNPSRYFSLETGFTVYRMSGMNVTGLDFETNKPLMGPFFSLFVPGQAVLKLPLDKLVFSLKGGGFAFYNFDNRIIYGNLDRAIREYHGWEVANADFDFDNRIGLGLIFGAELIVYVTKQFGLNFEANYLAGGSPVHFRGNYTGGNSASGIQSIQADYAESMLDFTGFEITMGILFSSK